MASDVYSTLCLGRPAYVMIKNSGVNCGGLAARDMSIMMAQWQLQAASADEMKPEVLPRKVKFVLRGSPSLIGVMVRSSRC